MTIHCGEQPMLGLLSLPVSPLPSPSIAVVIVNGGAQYRVGAHRLFVRLARSLASQGHAVLRFDLPGQGDSPGTPTGFQDAAAYLGSAIDHLLQGQPDIRQVVLLGLCDGASASLLYLHETADPRINGLVLLNPWVHTEVSSAKTAVRHYYRQRLVMPEFWQKLLAGGVGLKAMRDLVGTMNRTRKRLPKQEGDFQTRMALGWKAYSGPILLLISDKDLTGQEFIQSAIESPAWEGALQHPGLAHYVLQQADHTFSPAAAARDVNALIGLWIQKALSHGEPVGGLGEQQGKGD